LHVAVGLHLHTTHPGSWGIQFASIQQVAQTEGVVSSHAELQQLLWSRLKEIC